MSDTIRVGVIGLSFGSMLINSLARLPGVDVVAVADHSGRHLKVERDEYLTYFGLNWYSEGIDLIETEELEAVVICTPPAGHRPLVEAAAARGINILLEKPMAASVEDCEAMRRACDGAGVILQLEFPMRELPAVEHCRRLIDDGTVGPPLLISADYVIGPIPEGHWVWAPDQGGGPIHENTCHLIDTLRYLAGDIAEVVAFNANLLGSGRPAPDCAAFSVRFTSGALASVVGGAVGSHSSSFGQRINLYCQNGQALLDGRFHTFHRLEWHDSLVRRHLRDYGPPPVTPQELGPYEVFPLHVGAIKTFVRSVRDGIPYGATGADGQAAVAVSLAVLQSGRTALPVRVG
jgi:predicted dehydrogenase